MPPQNKIENVNDGDNGTGNTRPADNLTGSRTVDGKTVQTVQRTNPNFRNSLSDIPTLGTLGKSASSTGFAITDGDQVIASKTVQGAPVTEDNQQEPASETTYPSGTVINRHGKLLLQTGISDVPKVSQGIQNLDDLKALANGLVTGVSSVAGDTLSYLSKPNAVSDSLVSIGPALDNAVNYCANTPPDKVLADAQDALGYLGQAVEDTLGHPLTPEQRGNYAGTAMAAFFPIGANKALTEKELEALGGVQELEKMTGAELKVLGLERESSFWNKFGRTTDESIRRKLDTYLLEPGHTKRDSSLSGKADWFKENLGFTKDNADELAKRIRFDEDKAVLGRLTPNGQYYHQDIEIHGANGVTKTVQFNFIKNPDEVVRLIGTGTFPKKPR